MKADLLRIGMEQAEYLYTIFIAQELHPIGLWVDLLILQQVQRIVPAVAVIVADDHLDRIFFYERRRSFIGENSAAIYQALQHFRSPESSGVSQCPSRKLKRAIFCYYLCCVFNRSGKNLVFKQFYLFLFAQFCHFSFLLYFVFL